VRTRLVARLVNVICHASPVMFPLLNPYGHVAFQAQRGDTDFRTGATHGH
jgi:5-methylthioadenosine/S-adenosylhomocysteine deaminase